MASESPVDVHTSLKELEVRRALADVYDLWTRSNALLERNGRPPLPRPFYTPEEHAAAIAELTPAPDSKPREYFWSHGERMYGPAATASEAKQMTSSAGQSEFAAFAQALIRARGSSPPPSDYTGFIDALFLAMGDERIGDRRLREMCRLLLMAYRPGGGAATLPPERASAAAAVCDVISRLPLSALVTQPADPPPPADDTAPAPISPADREASAALLRAAILAGDVVQLPGTGYRIRHEKEKPL